MSNEKTVQILVSGMVQGVGFRWATRKAAIQLNIAGYVQNLNSGRVKIVAQGDQQSLKRFLKIIKASPTPYGHVTNLQTRKISKIPYSLFIVR